MTTPMHPAFEFAAAGRIVFGRGRLQSDLGAIAAELGGKRALLIAAPHIARGGSIEKTIEPALAARGIALVGPPVLVHGEPEVATVDTAAEAARSTGADLVIGIGGGATLDVAKAAAGLATNGPASVREYLEGVGSGRPLVQPALPLLAIPTTAGTGSEVTRNSVVASHAEGFKKSIRSPRLLPAVALVDPALTDTLPPAQTAASGLDALTQLIEPFVSTRANPLTDALALDGMGRAARALPRAYRDGGTDREARDAMALASLFGGLCLANAGLGAVHGIAAALGARFDVPHGLACACVLAQSVEANIAALERRAVASGEADAVLARFARVGEVLTGRAHSSPAQARKAAVAFLQDLVGQLKVPRLTEIGVTAAEIPALVPECRGSSMRYNPVVLEDGEIADILGAAL